MKKKGSLLIISLIIIFFIGISIGAYFFLSSKNSKSSNESQTLKGIDENMLCYDVLEQVETTLKESCNDDSLKKVIYLVDEKIKSFSQTQQKECSKNINIHLHSLIIEKCGEDSIQKMSLLMSDLIKQTLDEQAKIIECKEKEMMGLSCD
jgi:hypothetical protein